MNERYKPGDELAVENGAVVWTIKDGREACIANAAAAQERARFEKWIRWCYDELDEDDSDAKVVLSFMVNTLALGGPFESVAGAAALRKAGGVGGGDE